jgi:hypothetical protein
LTIDTEVHPSKTLPIRGRAEPDVVDGIPDEYLRASGTDETSPEQRVDWEAAARSLDDDTVRIVVSPTWATLIAVEATPPSAVEELVRQRDERPRAQAPRGRPRWVDRPRLSPTAVRGQDRLLPAAPGADREAAIRRGWVWITTVTVPFATRTRNGSLCPSVAPRSPRSL